MPGTGAADAPAVGQGDVPGVAGGVLPRRPGQARRSLRCTGATDDVAGALGGAHDDVDILGGLDVAVVDVEAVGKGQGVAGLEVILDVLLVDLGLGLVGVRRMMTSASSAAVSMSTTLRPASAAFLAEAEPSRRPTRTSQPESMRFSAWAWPLRAVADDGDLLP